MVCVQIKAHRCTPETYAGVCVFIPVTPGKKMICGSRRVRAGIIRVG